MQRANRQVEYTTDNANPLLLEWMKAVSTYTIFYNTRAKGYYVSYFYGNQRRQASLRTNNKAEADKKVKEVIRTAFAKQDEVVHKHLILSEFRDYYCSIKNGDGCTIKTIRTIRDSFNWLIRSIGDVRIDQILPLKIEKAIKDVSYNISSRRKHYGHLNAAFKHLVEKDEIPMNPLSKVKKPREKPTIAETVNDEEFSILMNSIPANTYAGKRLRTICILAYDTGMRLGELRNLKIESVAFADRKIHVTHNLTGNEDTTFTTKSGKTRLIPTSPRAIEAIKALITTNRSHNNPTVQSSEFLFINSVTGQVISENTISCSFKKYRRLVMPNKIGLHFHSLRHSFGTALASSNIPLFAIMYIMGHGNIRTTQRYVRGDVLAKDATIALLEERK